MVHVYSQLLLCYLTAIKEPQKSAEKRKKCCCLVRLALLDWTQLLHDLNKYCCSYNILLSLKVFIKGHLVPFHSLLVILASICYVAFPEGREFPMDILLSVILGELTY